MKGEVTIRPGRSLVVWTQQNSKGALFKASSNVAVSLHCESPTGCAGATRPSLTHELDVTIDKPARLIMRIQNGSGTRKARVMFEVIGG